MIDILVIMDHFNVNLCIDLVLVERSLDVIVKESRIINLSVINFDTNVTNA
jgi:hypothetical protein